MHDAVVISDLHLGSRVCQAKRIEEFLSSLPGACRLVLNGDVLEGHEHRLRKHHWRVLSLLRKLSDHVEVVWVRGNHDHDAQLVADLVGAAFVPSYEFNSGGAKLLCVHGDAWDDFVTKRPVLTWLADVAYGGLQRLSPRLAAAAKYSSKTFVRSCDKVRAGALAMAKSVGADTVLCGHTHRAESYPGYANSGCWTEETCHYLAVSGGEVVTHEF